MLLSMHEDMERNPKEEGKQPSILNRVRRRGMVCEDKARRGHLANQLPNANWKKDGASDKAKRGGKHGRVEHQGNFFILVPCTPYVLHFIPACFLSLIILKDVNQSSFLRIMSLLEVDNTEVLCSFGQSILFKQSLVDLR